jgi:hypothetical protein
MGLLEYDHNKQLITLTMTTLGTFHCTIKFVIIITSFNNNNNYNYISFSFRWGLLLGSHSRPTPDPSNILWWWPLPRSSAAQLPGDLLPPDHLLQQLPDLADVKLFNSQEQIEQQQQQQQSSRPVRVSLIMRSMSNPLSSSASDLSASSESSIAKATLTPMCQIKCDLIQEQLPQLHQQQEVIAKDEKRLPQPKRLLVTAVWFRAYCALSL